MEQRKYGLFTAITMIVGIVVGSGIFFKSYNVLVNTGGNVKQGAIAFCVAAISIVFGSLSIAELASRTDDAGGVISYSEKFVNKKVAVVYGWFHAIAYSPALTAVVSWVVGIYTCNLFGWEGTLENQVLVGLANIFVLYTINMINAKWGGRFQDISTVVKLIPLVLFAVVGLIFGNPSEGFNFLPSEELAATGGSWLAALPAVLFAFDGWIIASTICHEIRDSKRNMALALSISPIVILVLYVAYFIGISNYVGVETILASGSDHLTFAANKLLNNPFAEKLLIIFVIISVMGVTNGLILGFIRQPYSLAIRKMMPNSDKYVKVDPKSGVPVRSGLLSLIISLLWMVFHYVTQKSGIMGAGDVSEISIVVNYILFIILYIAVINLARKGEIKNKFFGYVCPVLATIGSLIVIKAGFTNPLFPYFLIGSAIVVAVALLYANRHPEIETAEVTTEEA